MNAVLTAKPNLNEVMIVIKFAKEEKKPSVIGSVNITRTLDARFKALPEEIQSLIIETAKKVAKTSDTFTVDLSTLEASSVFVPAAPTGYRTEKMKREDWLKSEVSDEESFDNLFNEGQEGFNPYRNI
jgi:hypothetical protein